MRGYVDSWRLRPLRPEPRGYDARREDPPPTVYGRGEALVILPPMVSGMHITNPLPLPPPEPLVWCVALENFSLGQGPDGVVRDVVVGEEFETSPRNARHLVFIRRAKIEPNAGDLAMKRAEEEAEQRERIKVAKDIAAGPAPAPVWPHIHGRVDAYGQAIEEAPMKTFRVRTLKPHCVGGGKDVQVGEVYECDEESALSRICFKQVEPVEDEQVQA